MDPLVALAVVGLGGCGLLNIFLPALMWRSDKTTQRSWQYKNPRSDEPSGLTLVLVRVGGGAMVVLAVVMAFAALVT